MHLYMLSVIYLIVSTFLAKSSFMLWFMCLFAEKYLLIFINQILLVIFQELLDWSNLGLLDYAYIFILFFFFYKNHVQMWVSSLYSLHVLLPTVKTAELQS